MSDPTSVQPQVSNWNIANVLTMLRIAMVPIFVWVLFIDHGESIVWRLVALAIFLLAAITDKVDGHLARSRGLITDLGKLLDPIADKALTGAAFISLSILGEIWWWVTIVILGREVLITVMRFVVKRYVVLPASRGGKLKTVLQMVAIAGFLLPLFALPTFLTWIAAAILSAAFVVTVITGLDYLVGGYKVFKNGRLSDSDTELRPSPEN